MSTLDEFIESIESAPWWRKAWWSVGRIPGRLRQAREDLICARERVRRGWDQRSLWGLDRWLGRTLGAQLTAMGKIAHGWPPQYEGGFEQWVADLKKHGAALTLYGAGDDIDGDSGYEDAQVAVRWVADNLSALWD